jgi:Copper transport outer membrane protein, MctB
LFSFRYHAISIVAVFLALGVGILLGVAIGENGIVSNASKDLERSLRGDLNRVRSQNADLKRDIVTRDEYERESYPSLVRDLLPGWRVGIVAMGRLDSSYTGETSDAVEPAGGKVDSVSVIKAPLPLGALASDLKGTKLARLDRSDKVLERFGRRIGRQFVNGGSLIDRVTHDLFSSSRGQYRGLDGIVYVRDRNDLSGDDKAAQDSFEKGLVSVIRSAASGAAGVEQTSTDPSQANWMAGHGLTSVDDLDLTAGKTALVYVLLGTRGGKYGVKSSADALLPPAPDQAGKRPG